MCQRRQVCFVFFFQAEDGIRDLVRSRGLGDVYKRQDGGPEGLVAQHRRTLLDRGRLGEQSVQLEHALVAVSYTHLTLPTSDLV